MHANDRVMYANDKVIHGNDGNGTEHRDLPMTFLCPYLKQPILHLVDQVVPVRTKIQTDLLHLKTVKNGS